MNAMDASASASSENGKWDAEDVIATHRALHRFMTNLLDEASVSALHTFLIQDNASILSKSASRSARANHKRLFLGRDQLITKEISRWESYPFEVDKPIVVARPKKAKNGCVPQRRAKRRSGLESAGEIKADILKKSESLPRAPRRRSSVRTDDVRKANMQDELMSLFEEADDGSVASIASINSKGSINSKSGDRPRRELSPHRWSMPKKPIRRVSEIPENLTAIYHAPAAARSFSLDSLAMDSQHSQLSMASTESTLSELGARYSDLSSVSDNSDLLATLDTRSLECAVIPEEDEREHGDEPGAILPPNGEWIQRNNSSQAIPRKPMRRASEIPADLGDPLENTSNHSLDGSQQGRVSDASFALDAPLLPKPEKLPPLARVSSMDVEDMGERSPPSSHIDTNRKSGDFERRMPKKTSSLPSKVPSMPRIPMRRPSEVPVDIIRDMQHRESLNGDDNDYYEAQEDLSDATMETLEERPSRNCSVILKEADAGTKSEQLLPPLRDTDKEDDLLPVDL